MIWYNWILLQMRCAALADTESRGGKPRTPVIPQAGIVVPTMFSSFIYDDDFRDRIEHWERTDPYGTMEPNTQETGQRLLLAPWLIVIWLIR